MTIQDSRVHMKYTLYKATTKNFSGQKMFRLIPINCSFETRKRRTRSKVSYLQSFIKKQYLYLSILGFSYQELTF